MKRAPVLAVLLIATVAWAASRGVDTDGAAPTLATDGVSLGVATGCRMSIRVDGGGNIKAGCKLVPWYYDPQALTTWTEADSTLHCTTTERQDGGARDSFVCPDLIPAARFGRIAAQKVYCTGADGGSGAAALSDAGPSSQPVVRVECWGPSVITP